MSTTAVRPAARSGRDRIRPSATAGSVAEPTDARPQLLDQDAALTAEHGLIPPGRRAEIARCLRVGLHEGQSPLITTITGPASRRNAVSPQPVRAQRAGANPDQMLDRERAPEA